MDCKKLDRAALVVPDKNQLDYTCGVSDNELTERFKAAIRIDEETRSVLGLPQARFDTETGKAYLEYPDGSREYVGKEAHLRLLSENGISIFQFDDKEELLEEMKNAYVDKSDSFEDR